MKAYLIGKPRLEWSEFARFARDENLPEGHQYMVEPPSDGETLAEIGGRICYMSFGKGRKKNAEYLQNIITQEHYSVLEHANFTFIFTGVSRSLTHELIRHRHFSFSQLSQRYVDESTAEFIIPDLLLTDEKMRDGITDAFHMARESYSYAVDKLMESIEDYRTATEKNKMARQAARAVLPNAVETKIVVTGNARAWREFIEKRNSHHADPEIRSLAIEVKKILQAEAPNLFYWPEAE